MKKFTVVIVCHNSENCIRHSIDSVVSNAPEIILIDDGSTDGTLDILKKYADSYPHVRLLINTFQEGDAICRNRALLYSDAEYMAIQRDCDVSRQDRFTWQIHILDSNPMIGLVGSHVQKINDEEKVIGSISYPPQKSLDMYACIMQSSTEPVLDQTIIFRRELVQNMGGFNSTRILCTFELVCRMLSNGVEVENVQDFLVYSRISHTNKAVRKILEEELIHLSSQFARRSYVPIKLDKSHFKQDCFTEYAYNIKRV